MISAERLGLLFTLVGPGGVGKNALLDEVLTRVDNLRQLPTATTRPIRPGEQQGREHLFVSMEEFQRMIDDGELLEHQEVHPGKFYGVPRSTVDKAIASHEDLIADIEMYGAAIIRSEYPNNSCAIFIAPPSVETVIDRLKNRQASPEDIEDRLNRFPLEMHFAPECDYLIVNDEVDTAVRELHYVIQKVRGEWGGVPPKTYTVRFKVCIAIMAGADVLCDRERQLPQAVIHAGEKIQEGAYRRLQALGIPTTGTLHYASPVTGQLPLAIDFDSDNYTITYQYVYRLSEWVQPPDGWQWMKRDEVVS